MHRTIIVFLILLSGTLDGQVDVRRYVITSDKDEVGQLIATKEQEGSLIKYEISSEVTVRILFKVQMNSEIQAVFKNDVLIYSTATLYLNGNIYSDTKIEKGDGFYTVKKDGDETKIYSDEIRSSSAKLYFHEPIGEEFSLSETEGEMKDVDIQGVKNYALTQNGNERSVSTYIYTETEGLNRIRLVRPYVPELYVYRVDSFSELDEK